MRDADASADERVLAARFAVHGDENAFRTLYRRHTPLLYRLAWRMTHDNEAAAEIVQDTWLRAAQRLSGFRWESRLSTWLAGIAINRSREELRRRGPGQSGVVALEAALAPASSPALRIDLERAIAQLPEGYREVLLLFHVEGYTHEEIAQALEIEPGTSRSQLTRARASLRALLEGKKEGSL